MGSAAGATGLLAMGAGGLAVGFAVGTEFLLGAGKLGLGVGTLGKLGMARAPRTPRFAFGALFLARVSDFLLKINQDLRLGRPYTCNQK